MLTVDKISASYGEVPILKSISLTVANGETVAIIGPNGAGKSTLVAAICGLLKPFAGTILLDGADLTRVPAHKRPDYGLAVVLETRNLFVEMTVADNLKLAVSRSKSMARSEDRPHITIEEVFNLFPDVEKKKDSLVQLLSGGQQQMVAIARSLLLQPKLLIMDELTTGLAPVIVREILTALGQLKQRGLSLLVVEQSVKIASEMADRTYVLSVGKIVKEVARGEWERLLSDGDISKAYFHG